MDPLAYFRCMPIDVGAVRSEWVLTADFRTFLDVAILLVGFETKPANKQFITIKSNGFNARIN